MKQPDKVACDLNGPRVNDRQTSTPPWVRCTMPALGAAIAVMQRAREESEANVRRIASLPPYERYRGIIWEVAKLQASIQMVGPDTLEYQAGRLMAEDPLFHAIVIMYANLIEGLLDARPAKTPPPAKWDTDFDKRFVHHGGCGECNPVSGSCVHGDANDILKYIRRLIDA
jgi:hypothetical protein